MECLGKYGENSDGKEEASSQDLTSISSFLSAAYSFVHYLREF